MVLKVRLSDKDSPLDSGTFLSIMSNISNGVVWIVSEFDARSQIQNPRQPFELGSSIPFLWQ